MDIVVWLRSLGLGKYEAAFRENDMDETVLSSLTLTSLEHRLKLLDAIAALRSDASGKDTATKKNPKQFTPLGFGSLLPQSGFCGWAAGVGGWGAAQRGLITAASSNVPSLFQCGILAHEPHASATSSAGSRIWPKPGLD
jgi:hypothetical protein